MDHIELKIIYVTSMQGLPVQCHIGGLSMGCEDCLDQKNPEIFDYSSNVEIDVLKISCDYPRKG